MACCLSFLLWLALLQTTLAVNVPGPNGTVVTQILSATSSNPELKVVEDRDLGKILVYPPQPKEFTVEIIARIMYPDDQYLEKISTVMVGGAGVTIESDEIRNSLILATLKVAPGASGGRFSITYENEDNPNHKGCNVRLLPVEITAAFGAGPDAPNGGDDTSRDLLETYLDGIKVARQGDVWAVNGKDAQGNDKIWGVEIVSDQAKLNTALSSGGRYVVFDGHSNFGLGPDFGGINITKIADLTNYGVKYTDVPLNFRLRGPVNDPTKWGDPFIHMQVGNNEIPAAPTNYKPLPIDEQRFPNIDGVGVGQAFQKQGQGFETWHYRIQGGSKRLMIDAPKTDLPANLAYKTFFYNACNTGIDYIENFKKGDFIYTNKSCFVYEGTQIFVQGIVVGKTTEQIIPLLNQLGVGSNENGDVIYEFKRF